MSEKPTGARYHDRKEADETGKCDARPAADPERTTDKGASAIFAINWRMTRLG